jgi:hypothetical protein
MKSVFNPGNPTPENMGYIFTDPETGHPVKIDDCQQRTGILAEYKGPGYAPHLLKDDPAWWGQLGNMLLQIDAQERARGSHRLVWFFAEWDTYHFMKKIFAAVYPDVRVVYAPMPRRRR